MTIATEGFDNYTELVKLEKTQGGLIDFLSQGSEYQFQSLDEYDNRLVDSLGWHLNLYDVEEPMFLTGSVDLYKGRGTDYSGSEYIYKEPYSMNWTYNDHSITGDIEDFNANN